MPLLLVSGFFFIVVIREVKSEPITDIVYYYLSHDEITKTSNLESVSGRINISDLVVVLKYIAEVQVIFITQIPLTGSRKIFSTTQTRRKPCTFSVFGEVKLGYACDSISRIIYVDLDGIIYNAEVEGYELHIEKYVGCFEDVNRYNASTTECSPSSCSTFFAKKVVYDYSVPMYHCACNLQLTDLKQVELRLCNRSCTNGFACGGVVAFSIYSSSALSKYKAVIDQPAQCIYKNKGCTKCPKGFEGQMCEYIDFNFECEVNEQLESVTLKTLEVYRCVCLKGYNVDNDIKCRDIDECAKDSCSTIINTKCRNKDGSYACDCTEGYKRNDPHSKFSPCYDINECETRKCDKKTTKCENTPGSYVCHCLPGLKKPEAFHGDMETCDDIDECLNISACFDRSNCTNKFGSYECVCHYGFIKVGERICGDVDECAKPSLCNPSTTTCYNLVGTYDCNCKSGFDYKIGTVSAYDMISCGDVDECETRKSFLCNSSTTTCVNLFGTYNCKCKDGYDSMRGSVSANVTVSCKDVDECETRKSFLCNPSTTTCSNLIGTYDCKCILGFDSKSGSVSANVTVSCEDVDECKTGESSLCNPSTTTCVNRNGTYDCDCKGGYHSKKGSVSRGLTVSCKDVDECASKESSSLCNPSATTCVNRVGTYDCNCNSGFDSKSGNVSANVTVSCEDIDECRENPCDADTTNCNNIPGAFTCDCRNGYTRIAQRMCKDIDECADLGNYCGKMSTCRNSPGSYDCDCPEGTFKTVYKYTVECKDRDECLDSPCDMEVSICLNTRDGFICHCKPGYINIDKLNCKIFTRTTTTFSYDEEYEDDFSTTQESTLLTEDNIFGFYIVLLVAIVMFLLAAAFYFYFYWMLKKKKPESGGSSTANSPPLSVSNL